MRQHESPSLFLGCCLWSLTTAGAQGTNEIRRCDVVWSAPPRPGILNDRRSPISSKLLCVMLLTWHGKMRLDLNSSVDCRSAHVSSSSTHRGCPPLPDPYPPLPRRVSLWNVGKPQHRCGAVKTSKRGLDWVAVEAVWRERVSAN